MDGARNNSHHKGIRWLKRPHGYQYGRIEERRYLGSTADGIFHRTSDRKSLGFRPEPRRRLRRTLFRFQGGPRYRERQSVLTL